MEFGLIPPEINSGRMYAGPGAGSMIAAAEAWDVLSRELYATATSYSVLLSNVTAGWRGPSSLAMAAAVAPYIAWLSGTAAQAEYTANQAKQAAAAYENAYLATVPPPVVGANRTLLAMLVATNLLGQNTSAIAAAEAAYGEMWAQDAAAMYAYAGTSSSAATLTPFSAPPRTTSQDGAAGRVAAQTASAGQAAAVQQVSSTLAPTLQAAADPPSAQTIATYLTSFFNATIGPYNLLKIYSPLGSFYDLGVQTFLAPFNNFNMQAAYGAALGRVASSIASPAAAFQSVGGPASVGTQLSADVGRAGLVGNLSVPQGWVSAAPEMRSVAMVLPQSARATFPSMLGEDGDGSVLSSMALSGMAGRTITGVGPATPTIGGGRIADTAMTATIIVIPED